MPLAQLILRSKTPLSPLVKRSERINRSLQSRENPKTKNRTMKRYMLALCASLSLGLGSCASGPAARTGTVIGGLGGAAAGAIIGAQSGRPLEGAAIGGGVGALAGNLLGDARDQRRGQARRW